MANGFDRGKEAILKKAAVIVQQASVFLPYK